MSRHIDSGWIRQIASGWCDSKKLRQIASIWYFFSPNCQNPDSTIWQFQEKLKKIDELHVTPQVLDLLPSWFSRSFQSHWVHAQYFFIKYLFNYFEVESLKRVTFLWIVIFSPCFWTMFSPPTRPNSPRGSLRVFRPKEKEDGATALSKSRESVRIRREKHKIHKHVIINGICKLHSQFIARQVHIKEKKMYCS